MKDPQNQKAALIDISQATRRPEELARLMVQLANQRACNSSTEQTVSKLDKLAEADYQTTHALACDLAQTYMPQHHYLSTINGGRFTNMEKQDPRYLVSGTKSGIAIATKILRKANGLPIVFQTSEKRPEGKYATVYQLGDLQRLKIITEHYDMANRITDSLHSDSNRTVVNSEELRGGQTGEYFGNHVDLLVAGVRTEVQVKDLASELRQEYDDYHAGDKYVIPGVIPLAQVEQLM